MSEQGLFSGRTLVVAFEGWNDAGEASSGAAKFLIESTGSLPISAVDHQEYFDFQFARPQVFLDEHGKRQFKWPNAQVFRPALP